MMELVDELLCQDISRMMIEHFKACDTNYNDIVQTNALSALQKIKDIIHNDQLDDFMMVDEIINVFIKYGIDIGGHHDF